ncbi:hypothetical protein [Virgibacillus salexigens]|uniref:Uncharacterized protein n=1 Tax=Virgibacillus massiliensis TaxID=1462526 RepID=A0A024QHU4_9BACI|nr:hypothetical protein [Virgibacillus massiliensis]CDQ41491.1 hypothetical protein BN990_03864 [Virgibacillus massiliensis]
MSYVEITAGISVIISLVLAGSTVVKNHRDNKRALETQLPIFKIEKAETFVLGRYDLLIRNVKDNFFVIKNVSADDNRVTCEYAGVFEIQYNQVGQGSSPSQLYKGHNIVIDINSIEDFEVSFNIEGVTISGRKFTVQTPKIKFKNKKIQNVSLQDRYLEVIKK